jgi:Fe-S oxidoreductase
MGLIYWWARMAAMMPGVANLLTQTPGVSAVMKWLGGIAPQRRMPAFAPETFKTWYRRRPPRMEGHPRVILWADTFNNHFFPDTARAAVEVLEAAGHQVIVPQASLCCGRPLYDFGMLTLAKSLLRQILDTLRPEIAAGTPVVGLEPSCTAVFRDELTNLFPHDEDAKRLAQQTYTLAEFLEKHAPQYQVPALHRRALVHGHCHQKAIMKMEAERAVYGKMGLQWDLLDSGCCGMAGSFGFTTEHYDVSRRVGELVLLPAVQHAAPDTILIADGFSCREQIAQTTSRRALHTAEVLSMALRDGPEGPRKGYPEEELVRKREAGLARARRHAVVGSLVAAVGIFIGFACLRRAFSMKKQRHRSTNDWGIDRLARLRHTDLR